MTGRHIGRLQATYFHSNSNITEEPSAQPSAEPSTENVSIKARDPGPDPPRMGNPSEGQSVKRTLPIFLPRLLQGILARSILIGGTAAIVSNLAELKKDPKYYSFTLFLLPQITELCMFIVTIFAFRKLMASLEKW
ncbi:unnamed protein product [Dibothriocephalus latus]|uniref:Uncharacterized protein n=1 Tax=Dibothriocephalus latus TaxID=60516 RepID=A0A3P7M8E3_DIBLA|nr:unnamed protein product [Dibothriocephalus latus]